MPSSGVSRANQNKAIRQEALREQLQAQGHLQHVINICEELNDLTKPMEAVEVQRKSKVLDVKLKLINKYCPDLKSVELSGNGGEELVIKVINYSDEKIN